MEKILMIFEAYQYDSWNSGSPIKLAIRVSPNGVCQYTFEKEEPSRLAYIRQEGGLRLVTNRNVDQLLNSNDGFPDLNNEWFELSAKYIISVGRLISLLSRPDISKLLNENYTINQDDRWSSHPAIYHIVLEVSFANNRMRLLDWQNDIGLLTHNIPNDILIEIRQILVSIVNQNQHQTM